MVAVKNFNNNKGRAYTSPLTKVTKMKVKYLTNGGKTIYLETEAEVDMFDRIFTNGLAGYTDADSFREIESWTDKEQELFDKFNSK